MLVRIGRLMGIRDFTPGGAANAFLLEASAFGFLLENGSGVLLMEV